MFDEFESEYEQSDVSLEDDEEETASKMFEEVAAAAAQKGEQKAEQAAEAGAGKGAEKFRPEAAARSLVEANGQLTDAVLRTIPSDRGSADMINAELERLGSPYRLSVEPHCVKAGYEGYHETVTVTNGQNVVASAYRGDVRPVRR